MSAKPPKPVSTPPKNRRYDDGVRRQSQRRGRERGCWVYIPLDELRKAGYAPDEPPPLYRVWGDPRGSVVVRLYRGK